MSKHPDSAIIDTLGGPAAVAALCEDVGASSVCEWRDRGIPAGWRKYLQQIRPAAFGLARAPKPPAVHPRLRRRPGPAATASA
jgi:hypothetical protein